MRVFDPSKPAIAATDENGNETLVNRGEQRSVLVISIRELAALLGIPSDHTIERISVTDERLAPGLCVMVEGPAMTIHPSDSPVMRESYREVIGNLSERREMASRYWLKIAQ